ncbi:MAG: DUF6110 family protein [Tissierellia bacterium]|nr:DUF6110 family protein [Tissierellia bacterium]
MISMKRMGIFIGGILMGSAGFKILGSKDAKNRYAHTAAAALRAKESLLTAVTEIRENIDDVMAEAKDINESRAESEEAELFEDIEIQSCGCDLGDE